MPRTCTVCNHPKRQAIEEGLLAGESFRNIAKQFATSPTALFRHKTEHLLESLQQAHDAEAVLRGDALIDHVRQLRDRTEDLYGAAEQILNDARRTKNLKVALEAIKAAGNIVREARGTASLIGQLTGELQQSAAGTAPIMIVVPVAHSEPATPPESAVVDIAARYRR